MTLNEFDLIARLIRSRNPARKASQLVLVEGYSPQQAADEAGCSYNSACNSVVRFRTTHKDILEVFGRKKRAS